MKLMTINSETKLPEPTAECLLIPSFRDLWKRKNAIDGDRDGRNKIRNLQEFGYIYYHGVWDSRFKFLDPQQRELKIREIMKLPEKWQPDDVVKECLEIFVDSQITPSLELVDSMNGANSDLSSWIRTKRMAIKQGTANPKDVSEILDIIERAPKLVEDIQKATEVLQREQDALTKGRKGRALNKFEA